MLTDSKCGTLETCKCETSCDNAYCVESTCQCKPCQCKTVPPLIEAESVQKPLYHCIGDVCFLPPLEISSNSNFTNVFLPAKFTRYKHPSHRHRLFMLVNRIDDSIECNGGDDCENRIPECGDTIFTCFDCEYDLCLGCFSRPFKEEEEKLSPSDDEIDDSL